MEALEHAGLAHLVISTRSLKIPTSSVHRKFSEVNCFFPSRWRYTIAIEHGEEGSNFGPLTGIKIGPLTGNEVASILVC